ncbi:MAG: GDCCVxC domain-containing (seleno)protein [Candidatus Peregrinibacteria bacterium]|nr:GDCCVxC domain-containing (seleno)protein [Candidatus Peregrinibacteria bacterium]
MEGVITCPHCRSAALHPIPRDCCQYCVICEDCNARIIPKPGQCCVFCSHGDRRCTVALRKYELLAAQR